MLLLLTTTLLVARITAQAGNPKITVTDQKGTKGGKLDLTFKITSTDTTLDKDQVHIVKASKDHKFSPSRFTVSLTVSGDKAIDGEATGDDLTCDDQGGYLIYYSRIPPPPGHGKPPGSFLLAIEECPPPRGDKNRPTQDPKITIKDQKTTQGASLTFEFTLESNDKVLSKDKVHMVKASEDHKTSPVRFTINLVQTDEKISGSAVADQVSCDDQGGYLIYYDQLPPPPGKRMRRQGPTPPPGGFVINVEGCSHQRRY